VQPAAWEPQFHLKKDFPKRGRHRNNIVELKNEEIMAKFNVLNYKRDLKNAQHFAFIQAFITALMAALLMARAGSRAAVHRTSRP
jgi:ABC-type transporter MlaC component